MRQIILLVLGIAIGAAGGISIFNTLRQRDAYPRGLMDVMQHHYASLRDGVRRGRCEQSTRHVYLLRSLAGEIGPAMYGEDVPDAPFREFESRLADALSMDVSGDCKALAPQVRKVGDACDACHRQYR